jgi:DNA-binding NarL/FixJ family response regulator
MNKIKVSIVEDNHEIRNGYQFVLNSSNHFQCASTYTNGEDALSNILNDNPSIIVMDINLPGISGIECIRRLKKKGYEGQFMMFTVYDDDENVFEAIESGAAGYLLKKTLPEKFIEALLEINEGGSPMSASIARKLVQKFQNNKNITSQHDLLSSREHEIITLISKGFLYKEVAEKLFITTGTVKQHIHKIYEKLHVQNKTEAINKYFKS